MSLHVYIILALVALVVCSVGFFNFVYFMSVGYGFAIAGLGISLMILYSGNLTLGTILGGVLFLTYGCRLSGFLLLREFKNKNYKKVLSDATQSDGSMPIFVKVMIWIFCAILYVLQALPLAYRLDHKAGDSWILWLGLILSLFGLILESAADISKSKQKRVRSDMVATQGLYRFTRCSNYCGEILFWTGVFVGALNTLQGPVEWVLSILGYVGIVYVMISGAKRLEKKQNKRYGESQEYRDYVAKTPILIPFLPIYHFSKNELENE